MCTNTRKHTSSYDSGHNTGKTPIIVINNDHISANMLHRCAGHIHELKAGADIVSTNQCYDFSNYTNINDHPKGATHKHFCEFHDDHMSVKTSCFPESHGSYDNGILNVTYYGKYHGTVTYYYKYCISDDNKYMTVGKTVDQCPSISCDCKYDKRQLLDFQNQALLNCNKTTGGQLYNSKCKCNCSHMGDQEPTCCHGANDCHGAYDGKE